MSVSFFKKILAGKTFAVGKYHYKFLNVVPYEKDDEETPAFVVNVETKNPFQSYCKQKMVGDVQEIIIDKSRLIGLEKSLSFGLDLTFNGREPSSIFVSQEDREKLIFRLNEALKFYKYRNNQKQLVVFEVEFSASENFVNVEGGDELLFGFDLNLRRFEIDGQPIAVIQKYGDKLGDFVSMIQQEICLSDNDTFRTEIENIIYTVLEPEIQLGSTEMYYTSQTFVKGINGVRIEGGNNYGVDINNFPEFI